jgi:hypothetical protein
LILALRQKSNRNGEHLSLYTFCQAINEARESNLLLTILSALNKRELETFNCACHVELQETSCFLDSSSLSFIGMTTLIFLPLYFLFMFSVLLLYGILIFLFSGWGCGR